eukprot:TRINITY_DN30127_c0_g1_i1.p1 TRINITY_DN30127_c0_g1~~TRINITY_DN30127_c0_g1_i1.p1  ORF type:complete len:557 (-),score=86.24 TRINITY_DN30127_c0_g1_i1:320-1990(-)
MALESEQARTPFVGGGLSSAKRPLLHRCCGPLGGGSQRASVLALASTAFGSGVLALPWVFSQLGFILGFLALASAAMASLLSQRLLANAAYTTGLSSYAKITKKTLGEGAARFLDVVIFLYTFGSVCGYFVFIEQFAPQLFGSLGAPQFFSDPDNGAWRIVVLFTIFPLTPLCLLRYLSMMAYATLLSVLSLVTVAVIIIAVTPEKNSDMMHHQGDELIGSWYLWPAMTDWKVFPNVMSICFYSYCCHVNLFAKYRELDQPTSQRVNKVLVRSVALELVVYALVGMCGCLALGPACDVDVPESAWPSCTPMNILASPRFNGTPGIVARVCMIITLLVCIPLNLTAGREVVEQRLLSSVTGQECTFSPAETPKIGRISRLVSSGDPDDTASPAIDMVIEAGQAAEPADQVPPELNDPLPRARVPSEPAVRRQAAAAAAAAEEAAKPQLSNVAHYALSLGFLYCAALVAIVYSHISVILGFLGGGCAVTFMFTIPIAVSLALFFRWTESNPHSQRIGRFLGVTKTGVIVATIVNVLCIAVGYLSAVLAFVQIVTGGSS